MPLEVLDLTLVLFCLLKTGESPEIAALSG
jgi:hypothetical protein